MRDAFFRTARGSMRVRSVVSSGGPDSLLHRTGFEEAAFFLPGPHLTARKIPVKTISEASALPFRSGPACRGTSCKPAALPLAEVGE